MSGEGQELAHARDVVIVGGGPAGLAAALAIRKRGMSVAVIDSLRPPIDKACGEGLMPDGVDALEKLGVRLPAEEGFRFHGIRFVNGSDSVEANFRVGHAIGVRRTVLHKEMVKAAKQAGVELLWDSVVTGVRPRGVVVNGCIESASWIVGADGSASRVRRWAGLDSHLRKDQRFAYRRHYRIEAWSDFMELRWGPRCQLYITPVAMNEVCVVLMSRDPTLRLDAALESFPVVAKRLRSAKISSAERGAETVTRKLVGVCSENIALLGDASGGVDAITGEGLCLAFKQAELLAESLVVGNLKLYQAGHRKLGARPAAMAHLMLLLENRERLRRRTMRAFIRKPSLFEGMLATHIGTTSAIDIAANGVALSWKLLTT